MSQKLYNRKFAKNGTQLKSIRSCGQSLGTLDLAALSFDGEMSTRVLRGVVSSGSVILFLSSLYVCVLSINPPSHEQYSKSTLFVNMKDPEVVRMGDKQEILRFGDKLRRKEVISRRKDTSIAGDSGELEIQLPDGGVRAPNGKTLNKMVIRTFKTTTSTTTEVPKSQHYYNHYYPTRNKKNKFTSTTSKPERLSSEKKSEGTESTDLSSVRITLSKNTPQSSTSSTESYSFPPFSKKEQSQKKNGGTRQYILRSSLATKATTTPYTTTVEATYPTQQTQTTENEYFPRSTEQPALTTLQEEVETTPVTFTSTTETIGDTPSVSVGRPVKVTSKTVSTVITAVDDSSYALASTSEPALEEAKPSRKPIHYILAVIGPPKAAPAAEEQVEEETTTVSSEGEQPTTTISTSTAIPPVSEKEELQVPTSTPGPYDHFRTVVIPASAITDNSPPFDVIPSVGNDRPNYRPFSATRAPPTRFNYFDTQSFKQDLRPRSPEGSPQLIPLQTVVTYTPDNSRNINRLTPPHVLPSVPASRSPFVTSKTVLYYTQVSPKDGSNTGDLPKFSNSGPSLNSIISGSEDQRGRIVSTSNPSVPNQLNAVPARSFYLDNLRLPVPSSVFGKPIPLVLNYSSV